MKTLTAVLGYACLKSHYDILCSQIFVMIPTFKHAAKYKKYLLCYFMFAKHEYLHQHITTVFC